MVNFTTGTTCVENQIMDSSRILFFLHFWREKMQIQYKVNNSDLLSSPIGKKKKIVITQKLIFKINFLDEKIVYGYTETLEGRVFISISESEKLEILKYLKTFNQNITKFEGIELEYYHTMQYANQKFRSAAFKYGNFMLFFLTYSYILVSLEFVLTSTGLIKAMLVRRLKCGIDIPETIELGVILARFSTTFVLL